MAHLGSARLTALATLFVALAVARRSESSAHLQALAETWLGWTDNVQSAPFDPLPGGAERKSDAFLIVSPGAALAVESPGATQRLAYLHSATVFFHESTADTSSNRLEYRGFWDLSRRVTLLVDANLVQASPHTEKTVASATTTEVSAMMPSVDAYLMGGGSWTLALEMAPGWQATQTSRVAFGMPLAHSESASTVEVGAGVGLERSFRADAVGARVRVDQVTVKNAVTPGGTSEDVTRQVNTTVSGTWRHDIGRDFASGVEAGVLRVDRLERDRGAWYPTGRVSLAYVVPSGSAEIWYSHQATTSVVLGQSFLVDEVGVRGGLPLTRDGTLLVGGSAGYQRGRLIEEDASLAARVDVLIGDVGLGWQVSDAFLLGLRYQHVEQRSDASNAALPQTFAKHTALVGLTFRLPPDVALPPPYRVPQRVDRSDEVRGRSLHDFDETDEESPE